MTLPCSMVAPGMSTTPAPIQQPASIVTGRAETAWCYGTRHQGQSTGVPVLKIAL